MANFSIREATSTRVEVVVGTPTNLAELDKAKAAVSQRFEQATGREVTWDNDINVTAQDGEIVLWFSVDR